MNWVREFRKLVIIIGLIFSFIVSVVYFWKTLPSLSSEGTFGMGIFLLLFLIGIGIITDNISDSDK